jgi:NAD(P)-dependent dehydrogenase (short-subunit alcohol dehydrogenase family)
MDLGLAEKVAIVNGSSQGIGYAIARLLAEEGARVAVTARRQAALHSAAERIRCETGREIIAIEGDIRQAADCERMSQKPSPVSASSTSSSTMTAPRRSVRALISMIRPGSAPLSRIY